MAPSTDILYRVILRNEGQTICGDQILSRLSLFLLLPGESDWILFCEGFKSWMEFIELTSRYTHEKSRYKVWRDHDNRFLSLNHKRYSFEQLAQIMNVSVERVKGRSYRQKLKHSLGKRFSAEELNYIKLNYRNLSFKEIGKQLGRSHWSIKHACQSRDWKRTADESRKIQDQYCSPSQYRPGQKPTNSLYDGATTIRKQKNGSFRKYLRIGNAKWVELQIHNWEGIYGKIPTGMCLWCLDGDGLNVDHSNWELITREENLTRNSGRRELTDKYIIDKLSWRNPDLKPALSTMSSIIQLKRNQIKLNRTLNECNSKN